MSGVTSTRKGSFVSSPVNVTLIWPEESSIVVGCPGSTMPEPIEGEALGVAEPESVGLGLAVSVGESLTGVGVGVSVGVGEIESDCDGTWLSVAIGVSVGVTEGDTVSDGEGVSGLGVPALSEGEGM